MKTIAYYVWCENDFGGNTCSNAGVYLSEEMCKQKVMRGLNISEDVFYQMLANEWIGIEEIKLE